MLLNDYFGVASLLIALLVVCGLTVFQIRKKPVALWLWFVPGTLILLYGLLTMASLLTEISPTLMPWANPEVDRTSPFQMSVLGELLLNVPFTTGVSGVFFAISAVIASFGGRVQSWRAIGQVGGVAVVGSVALAGWVAMQLASHETSMDAIVDLFIIHAGVVFWALAFVLALVACARGAGAKLSREHAIALAGLASCTGLMIALGCLAPMVAEQLFQVPSTHHWQQERELVATTIAILLPAGILACSVILVCTALMWRKSTAWVAAPKRRHVVALLALGVLVFGLMGFNAIKFQDVAQRFEQKAVTENLGPLPHSTDEYIVPASNSQVSVEHSGIAIIAARKSLRFTSYPTPDGLDNNPKDEPSVAYSPGDAIPEELVKKLQVLIAEKKRMANMLKTDYDPYITLAADQLTDYQTVYALMTYSYVQGLTLVTLLIRREAKSQTQAGVVNVVYLARDTDTSEFYNNAPQLHIRPDGFSIHTPDTTLPPQAGCPSDGPTICTSAAPDKLKTTLQKARELFLQGQSDQTQKLADEYLTGYDFRSLYNQMAILKKTMPDETGITISADPNIPHNVIVRALDAIRFSLEHEHYDSDEAFEKADIRQHEYGYVVLFGDPAFGAPRP